MMGNVLQRSVLALLFLLVTTRIHVSEGRRSFPSVSMARLASHHAMRRPQQLLQEHSTSFSTTVENRHESFMSRGRRRRYREDSDEVLLCSAAGAAAPSRSIPATLLRGAFLRIASDLSGGTAFESIKCRVSATRETALEALRNTVSSGGIGALWTGTPSRTVEGALVGSVFMLSSTLTKGWIKALGAGPTGCALAGGLVGGIAQAIVMTPAGMVFTAQNVNRDKPGHENDTAWSVCRQIFQEQGIRGMYAGFKPMAIRQASNWASRAGLTEIARSALNLQQYGMLGEIGSGVLGGLGSCWNTPIETVRVLTQRDLSTGVSTKTIQGYWKEIIERDGPPGLFRGITPRAFQAVWQTCFMVVVPNIMGI